MIDKHEIIEIMGNIVREEHSTTSMALALILNVLLDIRGQNTELLDELKNINKGE